jgi:hypothetical protein
VDVLPPRAERRTQPGASGDLRCTTLAVVAKIAAISEATHGFGVRVALAHPERAHLVGAFGDVSAHFVVGVAEDAFARRRQSKETTNAARQLR